LRRREFLRGTLWGGAGAVVGARGAVAEPVAGCGLWLSMSRAEWVGMLDRVARPVLSAAAEGKLQQVMPVEAAAGHEDERRRVTHLEAVGRTISGVAPWLEHGPADGAEGELRGKHVEWVRGAIASGVDAGGPGWLRWGEDRQTIVDAAFLALGLHRAPSLREGLSKGVRAQLADALRATRKQQPPMNNWLLFAAMIEVALYELGEEWDRARVDLALKRMSEWYVGDGVYGDGPHYHADYYDSFVMHPFLLAVLEAVGDKDSGWKAMVEGEHARATRYAAIQERTIAPDGSFAPIGRSLAYRCGAFHLLADAAYRKMLPVSVIAEQVRCGLSAVIGRTLNAPGTFDRAGWLQIGLCGHQPEIGETYISTGSLYLCTAAFLPLGLSAEDEFWGGPDAAWSGKKAWSGVDLLADHALD
jgi:hypothetical protein